MGIHAILLAAGASKRLGAPKQLININGRSLLRHMAKLVLSSKVVGLSVVLGAYRENLIPSLINLPLNILINPDWEKGMGTSLQIAMESVDKEQEAVLVMVCDQPYLTVDVLNQLIDTFNQNPNKIIASTYGEDIKGTPAIFPNAYFSQLAKVPDSKGARSLIKSLASEIIPVPFPNGDFDLDTPEDLLKWNQKQG